MKFGADIHYPQMMYPQNVGEYTVFIVAASRLKFVPE